MIDAAIVLALIICLRLRTKWPWIWVVPNGASFGLGIVLSLTWLAGRSMENIPMTEYKLLGLAPILLWTGPVVSYYVYKKFRKSWLANLPVFLFCFLAGACIVYVSDLIQPK